MELSLNQDRNKHRLIIHSSDAVLCQFILYKPCLLDVISKQQWINMYSVFIFIYIESLRIHIARLSHYMVLNNGKSGGCQYRIF